MLKSHKDVLGFDDRWLVVIGIPVISFLISALIFGEYLVKQPRFFITRILVDSIIYTTTLWLIYRHLFFRLRKKYPRIEQTKQRILRVAIGIVVIYFVVKEVLDILLHTELQAHIHEQDSHEIGVTIGSMIITFMVLGIYETIGFYTQLQKSILEKEQLKRENIQSQLEGLKNQVNPHFLFNSLNTLSYIIPEDPDTAIKFVQKLSRVYRYILEIRDSKLISLKEELEFLQAYTFLLKERFGENLRIRIDIPEAFQNDAILPLSLQILFENAIKHNIISNQRPLFVEIFIKDDAFLVVRNNLQKKNQTTRGTRLGLENIKNRYRFFSGQEVLVAESETDFTVTLPLIRQMAPTH